MNWSEFGKINSTIAKWIIPTREKAENVLCISGLGCSTLEACKKVRFQTTRIFDFSLRIKYSDYLNNKKLIDLGLIGFDQVIY